MPPESSSATSVSRRLLTRREAAAYLRVSERRLAQLQHPHGTLPVVRTGRKVLFDLADLDHFIDTQKEGG